MFIVEEATIAWEMSDDSMIEMNVDSLEMFGIVREVSYIQELKNQKYIDEFFYEFSNLLHRKFHCKSMS